MGSDRGRTQRRETARTAFTRQFGELYKAAGNPTLQRLAVKAAELSGPGDRNVTFQRISGWKTGRALPANFEVFRPVLITLIEQAKNSGIPVAPDLLQVRSWHRLWQQATRRVPAGRTSQACPYRGGKPYRGRDAELFFGRDRDVAGLAALIQRGHIPGEIFVLAGDSGVGKTSLLAAGLTPALTPEYTTVCFSAGADPVAALARATGDIDAAEAHAAPANRHLFIVDQAEEIFTVCHDSGRRSEFLERLAALSRGGAVVLLALRADVYQRCAGFPLLASAWQHRRYQLGSIEKSQLTEIICRPVESAGGQLEPGLTELIVTELCTPGGDGADSPDPGQLAVLSQLMTDLWAHRDGRRLTIAGYRRTGGVLGAVAGIAEEAWRKVPAAQRPLGEQLILSLVAASPHRTSTRRRRPHTDLAPLRADPASARVLQTLIQRRLITVGTETAYLSHEAILTAWPLLRQWLDSNHTAMLLRQRLEADAIVWEQAGRSRALLYRREHLGVFGQAASGLPLSRPAARFVAAARRRSLRARTALVFLGIVVILGAVSASGLAQNPDRAGAGKLALLAAAERLQSADPTMTAQFALAAHRLQPGADTRASVLRTQNYPLANLLKGHSGAVNAAVYLAGGKVLATASADKTVRLWDVTGPGPPSQLGPPLAGRSGAVTTVAAHPQRELLASGGKDGSVMLWDVHDPAHVKHVHNFRTSQAISRITFSPDGLTLALAGDDGSFEFWDLRDRTSPARNAAIRTHGPVWSMAFSPDGSMLATGGDEPRTSATGAAVQLWDVRVTTAVRPIGTYVGGLAPGALSIAFNPDSPVLAIASGSNRAQVDACCEDGMVQLWNIAEPSAPRPIGAPIAAGYRTGLRAITFGRDGHTLFTGTAEGALAWNIADPEHPEKLGMPLRGHSVVCQDIGPADCAMGPAALAVNPDGRSVAMAGAAPAISLWSLPPSVIGGQAGNITLPGFSADGRRMVTGSSGGDTQLWDLHDPARARALAKLGRTSNYLPSISPDGRTVTQPAAAGPPQQLLDVTDPARVRTLATLAAVDAGGFVPRSNLLLTVSDKNTFQLHNFSDKSRPLPLSQPIKASAGWLVTADFSADGKLLATLGTDAAPGSATAAGQFTVALWDISNPAHPRRAGELTSRAGNVGTVMALSPDKRSLITARNGDLQVWDISRPSAITALGKPVTAHAMTAGSIAFSPDSQRLAISGPDSSVQLWDFTNRSQLRQLGGSIATPDSKTWRLVFHPDRNQLAGAGTSGALRLWDLDVERAAARICSAARTVLTKQIWQAHVPQLSYGQPCD